MKKIALVLAGAFLSVSTMAAFDGKKSKVEQSELPQEVIQSLEESEYQNWEIQEAFKVEDDLTNEVKYELQLASDTDSEMVRSVTFNEAGEIISEEASDFQRSEDQDIYQDDMEQGTEPVEPGFEGTEPGIDQGTEPELDGTEPGTQPEVPSEQY